MKPEDFAMQLGQIKGMLEQVVRQNDQQIGQLSRLDEKVDQVRADLTAKVDGVRAELSAKVDKVRSDLTSKVDSDVKGVSDRMTGVETRLQKAEIDVAKKSVMVAGGASIMMMAVAEGIRALFKLKGGG